MCVCSNLQVGVVGEQICEVGQKAQDLGTERVLGLKGSTNVCVPRTWSVLTTLSVLCVRLH